MLSSFVLSFLLSLPGIPPTPAGAQVEISAWELHLPELPDSGKAARKNYGEIRPLMESELKDIETELVKLYATSEGQAALPQSLRVPKSMAEEAAFLNSMLIDERYLELERPVVKAWNAWTGSLVMTGLAKADKAAQVVSKESVQQAQQIGSSIRKKQLNAGDITDHPPVPKGTWLLQVVVNGPMPWPGEADVMSKRQGGGISAGTGMANHNMQVTMAMHAAKANDRQAPVLALNWAPMVEHMNACARRLMDYEKTLTPTENAGMKQLRVRAKIEFLERFRSSLWFSYVIWAHLASDKSPVPLKQLEPNRIDIK